MQSIISRCASKQLLFQLSRCVAFPICHSEKLVIYFALSYYSTSLNIKRIITNKICLYIDMLRLLFVYTQLQKKLYTLSSGGWGPFTNFSLRPPANILIFGVKVGNGIQWKIRLVSSDDFTRKCETLLFGQNPAWRPVCILDLCPPAYKSRVWGCLHTLAKKSCFSWLFDSHPPDYCFRTRIRNEGG